MTKYVFAPSYWDITVNELAAVIGLTGLTIDETMFASLPPNFHRLWRQVVEEQTDQNEVSEGEGAEASGLDESTSPQVEPVNS